MDDEEAMSITPPTITLEDASGAPITTPQFYYTTPPRAQMVSNTASEERGRLGRSGSGRGGSLSRLARRLSQKEPRRSTEERKRALRQRSVSLDCGEGRRPLINSDHLEPQAGDENSLSIPTSPSLPSKLTRSTGSSSPNLTNRHSRKASGNKSSRKGASDSDGSLARERRRKHGYDLQALFEGVEQQEIDKVKEILDTSDVDINSVNEEELTPLDIAILTDQVSMSKMLLTHGARENPKFQKAYESRAVKLISLVNDAERRVLDFKHLINGSSGNLNVSTSQQKENEKQLGHWEFRHKLLKKMKHGYDHAGAPDPPVNVTLAVGSSSSLFLMFDEPLNHNGALVTRYKVEWSCYEDFSPLAGEQIIDDPRYLYYEIPGLVQGNKYYARVRAWNMKGFGEAAFTDPPYAVPSSWREVDNARYRPEGKLSLLDNLFSNLKNTRPADASELKGSPKGGEFQGMSPLHPRKSTMRKSLKNLFSSSPRFQKYLKRGVYLACLIYNEDRILVTNEDYLPIIEVDENFSGTNLNADFHWLMKIACTWEDVKSLRRDMEKSSSSGIMLFRSKLLQAAAQLQTALGIQDLGQFYYKPSRDMNGSIVLTTVNYVRDSKGINTNHAKWTHFSKLHKKVAVAENMAAPEMLLTTIPEMVRYHQASVNPVPRGLYLGYLKLRSSVDLIRIMVSEKQPNVMPFVKIRECSNVSKDEWEWVRSLSLNEIQTTPTPTQAKFQQSLSEACQKLLQGIGISEDEAVSHRLYDLEVIELSEDVSYLLLLPPIENVCSIPGHPEEFTKIPGHITLPVQVFEMIHMCTYQREFIRRYARLSSILEMDMYLAQQSHREAFSTEELSVAKDRLEQITQLQQTLDEAWKSMRWTMDIITYARDKSVRGGLPLGVLNAPPPSPTNSPNADRKCFETGASSSSSDVASSSCSDCGYHSDRSSADTNMETQNSTKDKPSQNHKDSCGCPGNNSNPDREDIWTKQSVQPGILRVYAAYQTGLAKGTSVKLHVTPRTTSREVINLVVRQLNKAVASKGMTGPIYSDDDMNEFCLAAVIGARERVLRDDYQPLQLQNPWTKGRLYVRLKTQLLAALEQGHVTSV